MSTIIVGSGISGGGGGSIPATTMLLDVSQTVTDLKSFAHGTLVVKSSTPADTMIHSAATSNQIITLPDDSGTVALEGHTHAASDIVSGLVDTARLGTGSPSSSKFLRGDQTWAAASPTLTEIEIDFGSVPVFEKSFAVTDAAVSGSSMIHAIESGSPATGRADGDALWDAIVLSAKPGSGSFVLNAKACPGPVVGKRKAVYLVAG